MNQVTYTASISPSNNATATFYSITKTLPDLINNDISKLSDINYPIGQVPAKDKDGYLLPNAINQAIFMNQPLSWWISNLNNGKIQYRPISNTINWAYISTKDIYISMNISKLIIPNKTKSIETNTETNVITITYEDNNCILLKSSKTGMMLPKNNVATGPN
jgi:hypothetical protein